MAVPSTACVAPAYPGPLGAAGRPGGSYAAPVSRVDQELGTFPGAVAPDRTGQVDAHGVGIATYEWGDAGSPPLFIAHGGFDFARTFDVFAPLLAAGGWRVVAWDQRGHGDSDHVALYSWDADLRDAVAVMQHVTT